MAVDSPVNEPSTALHDALYRTADPGYFSALQIPLLKGRFFTSEDRAGHPKTTIISSQLAQQYFPGEDPLGKHLRVTARGNADYEIVGVVADTLYQVGQPGKETMYVPVLNGEIDPGGVILVVRTASDALASSVPIQKQIAELDPELPVSDVLTIEQIIEAFVGPVGLSGADKLKDVCGIGGVVHVAGYRYLGSRPLNTRLLDAVASHGEH